MVSVDSLCKQFRSRSGSRLFATLKVFLKEHFENVNFEKVSNKSMIQLNMCGQLASGVRCLVFDLVLHLSTSVLCVWKQ